FTARFRKVGAVGAALLAVAALAGGVFYFRGLRAGSAEAPLRVLVPPPTVAAGSDPRLTLAASGVLDSALASLASLQGIAPLDPRQLDSRTKSVEPPGNLARVTLRRLQGNDGRLIWTETFQVASEPADLRLLAEAVALHLRRGYPEHRLRPEVPAFEVRNEDYAAYLALKQRMDAGRTPAEPDFVDSETIVSGSPRFLAGLLTAGSLARSLFVSTKEARYLERARALARQAEELAPGDPQPLALDFRAAVAAGREGEPEAVLARLEAALPGDPAIFSYRAQ